MYVIGLGLSKGQPLHWPGVGKCYYFSKCYELLFQGRQINILKGDNKHDQYTYYGRYMMLLQEIENATIVLVLGC